MFSPFTSPFARKAVLICLSSVCVLASSNAADIYLLPQGVGTQEGSSWQNAKAGISRNVQQILTAASAGDTLHLGSGNYGEIKLILKNEGTAGKPVRLVGEDLNGGGLPVLTSSFDRHNPEKSGAIFLQAEVGASNFEVIGLHLKGYRSGVVLKGRNSNVKLSRLLMEESRDCIISTGGGTAADPEAATHNVTVSDCQFIHFTKRGIRILDGSYNWRIERCVADAGGEEWATEPFAECYHVIGSSGRLKGGVKEGSAEPLPGEDCHHIEFVDCVARNAFDKRAPDKYWNADGFCAELGNHHLRYVRCLSTDHTDGGWDDKSIEPEAIDCVALRSKRNFRFWNKAKMTNCVSAYSINRGGSGGSEGLWTNGMVTAEFCTFYNNYGIAVQTDDPAAKVTLDHCLLATNRPEAASELTVGNVEVGNSVLANRFAGPNDPQVPATPTDDWTVASKQFDSKKYGVQTGFNSSRIK